MDKLRVLEELGAVKKGHFLLTSGLHSDTYFEKFRLMEYPHVLFEYIKDDVSKIKEFDFDAVIGPEFGGAFITFALASLLKIPAIYAEKDSDGGFFIGRGFQIHGKRLLLTDDVLTTGSSIKKLLKVVKDKATIVGIYVLVDRREEKTDEFTGIPLISGLKVSASTYRPEACPLCEKGIPLTTKKTGIIK